MTVASGPWPAPAKLNLMLRVIGRRSDGYHELQTVFQFLRHGDALTFRSRDDGRIERVTPLPGISTADDLSVKAARLLRATVGGAQGVDIAVDKRLPLGGGLGGGSSDAATTLVALNHLWGAGLPVHELARLGLALGADVPVFVRGQAAWAEGVGERLQPLTLPEPWFLVVVPACAVSTAAVFQHPDLTRNSPRITIRDFLDGAVENDCWPVVRQTYPEVAAAHEWLGHHANARLTGTGAGVFAAFEREAGARAVLEALPAPWAGFVARSANRSPLIDWLDRESETTRVWPSG